MRFLLLLVALFLVTEGKVYDYIVVGSGATGSVIATRLALSKPTTTVLVIEAGGPSQADLGGKDFVASRFRTDPVTGEFSQRPLTRYDVPLFRETMYAPELLPKTMWNFTVVGTLFQQAKLIGGNMAWNGLSWTRAVASDLDGWNVPGWSWNEMLPYTRKTEDMSLTPWAGDTQNHSTTGPIMLTLPSAQIPECEMYLKACAAAGYPLHQDFNNGAPRNGCGYVIQNVRDGVRDTSAVAMLAPALKTRTNIKLRSQAQVMRVLFRRPAQGWTDEDDECYNDADYDEPNTAQPVAKGVEYITDAGVVKRVRARKEVILACGALLTPKLLMNSGIGPASQLAPFGITPVVTNELIGQKIRNHLQYRMRYRQSDKVNANLYNLANVVLQYSRTGEGHMAIPSGGPVTSFFKAHPSATRYDVKIQVLPGTPGLYDQTFDMTLALETGVYANGTITLTGPHPLDPPRFTSNHQINDKDIESLAYGVLKVREIWNNHPNLTELIPGAQYETVSQLKTFIKPSVGTVCHYYSSVPMGTDSKYPADQYGRIRGVKRLRVGDPSLIPNTVSGGMQPMAVAIAERIAAFILEGN